MEKQPDYFGERQAAILKLLVWIAANSPQGSRDTALFEFEERRSLVNISSTTVRKLQSFLEEFLKGYSNEEDKKKYKSLLEFVGSPNSKNFASEFSRFLHNINYANLDIIQDVRSQDDKENNSRVFLRLSFINHVVQEDEGFADELAKAWVSVIKKTIKAKKKKQKEEEKKRKDSPSNSSSHEELSLARKIAEELLSVDYGQQEKECDDAISSFKPATAILCHAADERVQRWIVARLVRHLHNFSFMIQSAKKIELDARLSPLHISFDYFWSSLKQALEIDDSNPDQIIEALCRKLQTSSIVIAIYEIDQLPQESQQRFMTDFWDKVCQRLSQSRRNSTPKLEMGRLFLLMTTAPDKEADILAISDRKAEYEQPVKLTPLTQISASDAKSWISRKERYTFMKETGVNRDNALRRVVELKDSPPSDILRSLCCALTDKYKFSTIEEYWRLEG